MPELYPVTRKHAPGTAYTRTLSFRGGKRSAVADEDLSDNECSDCLNYIPDKFNLGSVVGRPGLAASSAALGASVTSIHEGLHANYATAGTTIVNLSGASLATGLTNANDPDWVTFANNDIMCNGTEVQTSTNGTSFGALGGTPPAFRYMATHSQILYGAGHSVGVLRWAQEGTVATWTATFAHNITTTENNNIMGLASYKNVLVVLCRHSIHHVNGSNAVNVSITYNGKGIGTTSHRSIGVTPDFLFFWTDMGLAITRQGTAEDVQFPLFERIPDELDALNKDQYDLVHCVWNPFEQCIHCFVHSGASQATVNRRLDYYYNEPAGQDARGFPIGSCWPCTSDASASGLVRISGEPRVYLGNTRVLYIDPTSGTDAGVAFSTLLESKQDSAENLEGIKRNRAFALNAITQGSTTQTLRIFKDGGDTVHKSWALTLDDPNGFLLDQDLLDNAIPLGLGDSVLRKRIAWTNKHRSLKFSLEGQNALRPQIRSIIHRGYHITA